MIKKIKATEVVEIFGEEVSTIEPSSFEDTRKIFNKHSATVGNVFKRLDKDLFAEEFELYQTFKKSMNAKIEQAYTLQVENCRVFQEEKQKFYEELLKSEDWWKFSLPAVSSGGAYFSNSENDRNLYYTNTFIINTSNKSFKFKKPEDNVKIIYCGHRYNYMNHKRTDYPEGAFLAQAFDSKMIPKLYPYHHDMMIDGSILFDGKDFPEIDNKVVLKNLSKQIDKMALRNQRIYDFIMDSSTTNSFKELLANKNLIK